MTIKESVKQYREMGLNVIPVKTKEKRPDLVSWTQYHTEPFTGDFSESQNIAVVCGKISQNLIVVDIDNPDSSLIDRIYPKALENTLVVKSGSGGHHIYLRVYELPKTLRLNNDDKVHIDIQSNGVIAVLPPSVHPNGNHYEIVSKTNEIKQLTQSDLEEIFTNLKQLGFKAESQTLKAHNISKGGITKGSRNNSAFKYACYLLDEKELDEETAYYEMQQWNKGNDPPLDESELKIVFNSALKTIQSNPQARKVKLELKELWAKVTSDIPSDDKEISRQRINEIQKEIGVEVTKFPTPEISKELDKYWKIKKSKKGNGVTKKEKRNAEKKINELQKLSNIPITDFENVEEEVSDDIQLLELAKRKILKTRISLNDTNAVYAVVKINGHFETMQLGGKRSKWWLNNLMSHEIKSDKIYTGDFYKNILDSLVSTAQMENVKKENIYNRIAFVNNEIIYDLSNANYEAISISKDEIKKIQLDETTPLFSRSQSMIEQDEPTYDDSPALDELAELLQIKDVQLFKVHITTMFLEHIPVPIMLYDGSAGTGKTITSGSIKRIIDPSGITADDNVLSIPKKYNDIISTLFHRYCSALENVSKIDNEISDIFCRAVTGSGNPKRKLFDDIDEIILTFKRKIIINGIVPNLDNPDLQQRIISYDRHSSNFKISTIDEFEKKYNSIKPSVLGLIFKTLQDVLSKIDDFDFTPKTRMADFEKWGELISQSLGYGEGSFVENYHDKLKMSAISSKDGHPIISIIEDIMLEKNEYQDTMRNLFVEIKRKAFSLNIDTNSKYVRFPKIDNQLSKELVVVQPVLEKLGLSVLQWNNTSASSGFGKNVKVVKISKMVESNPSTPNVSKDYNEGKTQ